MTRAEGFSGRDPREIPNYTVAEAAHWLALPVTTLRAWVAGQEYATSQGRKRAPALIEPAQSGPFTLSFWNLVEAHVLAATRRLHGVAMQRVRRALKYVERELDVERPLVNQQFETDGADLFVRKYGELVNASQEGQIAMRRLLEARLRRIERDMQGLAARLFPWARSETEAKDVMIDPLVSFGRPVLARTGVPLEVLADRFVAGDSISSLARDYSLDAERIEGAIRWQLDVSAP
jgi:uncharacterized protein (DUF433 family)